MTATPSETELDARLHRLGVRFLESVQHSVELGMSVVSMSRQNGVVMRMAHSEQLVGNPWSGIVHGGALLALLDQAGGLAAACQLFPDYDITPTLDLRIDHLHRPAPGVDFFATAHCYRQSAQILFIRGQVHQGNAADPVSTFVATYMRLGLNRSMLKANKSS